ncbi:RHS repeat-associated core domain-containing protein [Actinorugispora endophytica]|uniref:RHS repeat-associated core domain-containing protein n=1 Tax=Actinorugispora endophytica TaxID=1605990 RepID=UPI003742EEA7
MDGTLDASIGRFVSPDPVIDFTDPQQIHGYAYSGNNPVTFIDPTGLLAKKASASRHSRGLLAGPWGTVIVSMFCPLRRAKSVAVRTTRLALGGNLAPWSTFINSIWPTGRG